MHIWQKIWPKHSISDQCAFSFTHFGLIGIFLFEMFIVLPVYHEPISSMYCLHFCIGLYMAWQVFSNLYAMVLTGSTVMSYMNLPSMLYPGWMYCPTCQLNSPPRSHHCPVCNVCVVKRDHHCIFSGNCVGFHNHRYFIMMTIHLWLGCLYSMLFNIHFYTNVLGDVNLLLALKLVFPMVAWMFGFMTLYELLIAIVMGINCMAMFLFTALLFFQVFFISKGQTQFEYLKNIRLYSRNIINNWKVVLGERWYLTWISCFVTSKLPGDGTDFEIVDLYMSPVAEDGKTV